MNKRRRYLAKRRRAQRRQNALHQMQHNQAMVEMDRGCRCVWRGHNPPDCPIPGHQPPKAKPQQAATISALLATCLVLFLSSSALAQSANRSGPPAWNGPTPFHHLGGRCAPNVRWCLGTASVVRQDTPMPNGGPQALEGYTIVAHKTGSVALVLGTIGNIELAGASGTVTEKAVALSGGLVVNGEGVVNRPVALSLRQPVRFGGYKGPLNVKDPIYIEFDNGWTIRPNGPYLLFCDPFGTCRTF